MPITSNATVNATIAGSPRDAASDPAEIEAFTTLLAQSALKPLANDLGVVGSAVTDAVADEIGRLSIARGDAG